MKLILKSILKYKVLFCLDLFAVIGFVFTELSIPTLMSTMIDIGVANSDKAYVLAAGKILIFIAVFGGLSGLLLNYAAVRISTNVTRDIRHKLFSHVQDISHADFNKFGVSSMITRTTSDPWQLQLFIQMLMRTALMAPIMIISSVFFIVRTSPSLSLVMLASLPVIVIGVLIIAQLSKPLSIRQQKLADTVNRIMRENITGIRVVRAFRKDKDENERFSDVNTQYRRTSTRLFRLMSFTDPIFYFFLNAMMLVIMWIAAQMIGAHSLQVGQLVAFLEYQFHAVFSMMLFCTVFIMYPRAAVSSARIQEVLDVEPSIEDPEKPVSPLPETPSSLEFNHVNFRYPDGEAAVLSDISFIAKAGETTAFIGSTGSGKSTLVKLITRFFDVSSGRILLNGIDVRDYDLQALRAHIGFVPQKAFLFSGSILDNIKMGKEDATIEEVEHAATLAEASQFIHEKPDQYNEQLAEGGTNISGGQRQRISIARALIKPADVYVFDDSFSALDYRTDSLVRANLKREVRDAVICIVAQRISSIINAEQIIVLNEGKIVGKGRHQDLMKSCDIYQQIAHSQLSREELEHYA